MKLLMCSLAAALSFSAAAARASTAPRAKVHVVEGEWPSVELLYAPWVAVKVAYPVEDGKLDRYAGSFDVEVTPGLRAVERAADRPMGQAPGHIRLERRDGEKLWHVVAFVPSSPL